MFLDEEIEEIRIVILGSTGSIGRQTIEVVRSFPDRFKIIGLAAGSDADALVTQADELGVNKLALASGSLEIPGKQVITGPDSAASLVEECEDAQIVLNAVVGAAGLRATFAAIGTGKTLALANKESLVAGGEAVMAKASPGQIRPVDSEHSAIWQLLDAQRLDHVRRVIITASGGPFRGRTAEELQSVTVDEALAHPVWKMGRKITVDSATLMNKGLEVIEAHFLFGFTYDEIDVLIHPEGIIHGVIELNDGSVMSHAALPDMRLPIQDALSWPERLRPPGDRLELSGRTLSFEPVDLETFPSLRLAYEAGRLGDTYPAVLNAANEVAVGAFLTGGLKFMDIAAVVERTMETHTPTEALLESVIEQDGWARERAQSIIAEVVS